MQELDIEINHITMQKLLEILLHYQILTNGT